MFIGRRYELELLEDFYKDNDKKVACLTGQLGMGKTTLLKEFVKDRKHIFHIAYPTTEVGQLVLFARAMQGVCDTEGFDNSANLKTLSAQCEKVPTLVELLDAIEAAAGDEKLLLIIDEYNNFVKADASYEKTLHEYFTEKWVGNNIKLIMCGSSFLSMDKYVLGKKAIWKGADITSIRLDKMGFYDSCQFFPDKDANERAFLYGITGGIPGHLAEVNGDLENVLSKLFLDAKSGTRLLPESTMSLDLRELSYYNRILMTLAQGNARVNQISAIVNKPKDVVVPYMNTLMSIGVVQKHNAITEKNNRKKTRYGIVNTNYLFWYRYVVPNIDKYYSGELSDMYTQLIKPEISDYMKTVFISMCKEYIKREADNGKLPFTIDDIGNWWENDEDKGTSVGFDLVALGKCEERPCTVFARCYYSDGPIEMVTLKGLIEMTKHVSAEGDVFYVVFSRSGFHENTLTVAGAIKNIMLITLDDVAQL
ncbi:MAG: AAA family ATPase [Lachnospiraceae bacterium]|nr:AAA family ATPase [Lachnospiraceae bacterium]